MQDSHQTGECERLYEAALSGSSGTLKEDGLFDLSPDTPEYEIQARWFAGDFGDIFQGSQGETVRIVQFGEWNREAGPDFVHAAVEIDGEVRGGAVEIDPCERDWERHGHGASSDYEQVVLHVVLRQGPAEFFTRTASGRAVPRVVLQRALAGKAFACRNLPLARPGRCVAPLAEADAQAAEGIVHLAAVRRMRRKATRLKRIAQIRGTDEALFLGVAEALGYRENKTPFSLLAQRLTLKGLSRWPAEAVLLGVGGFLERSARMVPAQNRVHFRNLWEQWWPLRSDLERFILEPAAWKLSGVRPTNHPQRRLAALAVLCRCWARFREAVDAGNPAEVVRVLTSLEHPFWQNRTTLASRTAIRALSLIGQERATDIFMNVVAPMMLDAAGGEPPAGLLGVAASAESRKLQTAKRRLFGGGDSLLARRLGGTAFGQQGILQIYEDFCLPDLSDCAECPFPRLVAAWR